MRLSSHLSECLSPINNKQQVLASMWRKGDSFALLVGILVGAATVGSSMKIPQKIKNRSSFWPSDPTSGTTSEETLKTNSKWQKYPCVHCSVIYNHQDTEAAQVSSSRWVDKTTRGYLQNGILLGHKKEEKCTLCDSMDRTEEHYAKRNKPVWERQIPYDSTHLESNEQTELTSKVETDS